MTTSQIVSERDSMICNARGTLGLLQRQAQMKVKRKEGSGRKKN